MEGTTMNPSAAYIKWVKGEQEGYDWLDITNFLLIANAEITDYNISEGEMNKIAEISERMFSVWCGEGVQFTTVDVKRKLQLAFSWYEKVQNVPEGQIDQAVMSHVKKLATWLKQQDWFNEEFANSVISWMVELAEVDGVNENEKGSTNSLAEFWGVKKPF